MIRCASTGCCTRPRRAPAALFAIISEYDKQTLLAGQFLPRLRVAYAERVVETVRKRLRGSVHRVNEGSLIKIRVRHRRGPVLCPS
jgi:hypothetical protein